MEVSCCAIEASFWIPARSGEPLSGLIDSVAGGEATIFNVAVPATVGLVRPVNAVFALAGCPYESERRVAIAFTWSHQNGFPLPSMCGEIVTRRLGPMTKVRIRARYTYDDDAPGRLFHEAIGARIGRKTLDALVGAIQLLVVRPGKRREKQRT